MNINAPAKGEFMKLTKSRHVRRGAYESIVAVSTEITVKMEHRTGEMKYLPGVCVDLRACCDLLLQ